MSLLQLLWKGDNMNEEDFEENASAIEDGDFHYTLISEGADFGSGQTKYLVVRVREPITGEGSLIIKVQQSASENEGFVDIPGLTLTINSQSNNKVFSVGNQTEKYTKATRVKAGEITGGIIHVSCSSDRPIFTEDTTGRGERSDFFC